jgi:uncharacterized protein
MKKSRYSVFVETPKHVYAVSLLSRTAMMLSPIAYRFLEAVCEGGPLSNPRIEETKLLAELCQSLFLIDDDFDELAYIRYRYQQERFSQTQFGLVIAPTLACNFRCHYCFENKSDHTLSTNDQKRLLQLVAANLPRYQEFHVQWFGGEPLLALDILHSLSQAFLALSEAAQCSYGATLVTNGELLTPSVSRELAGLGVQKVQITLDGMRELHDHTRYSTPGVGSFDTILDNLRSASEYFHVSVRVHVAPYGIPSIHALLDYLAKIELQPNIAELYFAPVFNYRAGMSGLSFGSDGKRFMSSADFASVQTALLHHAASCGFTTSDFLDASYGLCTAVRAHTLVVNADGHLFRCYLDVGDTTEEIGNLTVGPQPRQRLLKWLDYEFWDDVECCKCQFVPVCLGGCPKQRLSGAAKDVVCTPLKFNIEDRVKLYFESPVVSPVSSCTSRGF